MINNRSNENSFPDWFQVSRETLEKFHIYHSILGKWQKKVNLVSASTMDDFWQRHIMDSAQLYYYINEKNAPLTDLGSGAGFPGMVLAMMGCNSVTLIESDQKKGVFLQEIARETSTAITIVNQRIESVKEKFVIITSRACAALDELLNYSASLMLEDAFCLFPKGKNYFIELESAYVAWDFNVKIHPSKTDPIGKILEIKRLARKI